MYAGKRNGYGEMYWSNGGYYIGYWVNDMMHGKGKLIKPKRELVLEEL